MGHAINLITDQLININIFQQCLCAITLFTLLITFRDFVPGFLRCINVTYIASLEEKRLNHKKTIRKLKLMIGESAFLIGIVFIPF